MDANELTGVDVGVGVRVGQVLAEDDQTCDVESPRGTAFVRMPLESHPSSVELVPAVAVTVTVQDHAHVGSGVVTVAVRVAVVVPVRVGVTVRVEVSVLAEVGDLVIAGVGVSVDVVVDVGVAVSVGAGRMVMVTAEGNVTVSGFCELSATERETIRRVVVPVDKPRMTRVTIPRPPRADAPALPTTSRMPPQ